MQCRIYAVCSLQHQSPATSKSTKPKNSLSDNVENTLTKKSEKTLSESLRMKVATAAVPSIAKPIE